MTPATGADAQAVLDAAAAGDPIPNGFAFDGTTAYVLDAEDEERIAEGGPVVPPEDPSTLNPGPLADAGDTVTPEVGDRV